jgi:hypothetical protein
MNTRNGNGTEPGRQQSGDSYLRKRLAEQSRPDQEPTGPEGELEKHKERMAELAMAETQEFSETRMSERLADSIAPVADRAGAALGRSLQATAAAAARALRATGLAAARALQALLSAIVAALQAVRSAFVRALRAIGAAIATGFRALGSGLLRALRAIGAAIVRTLLALASGVRALPRLVSSGAAGLAGMSSGGAAGLARGSRERLRDLFPALVRLARERPRLLVAGTLWLFLLGYGAGVLAEHVPILRLAARETLDDTSLALHNTGAGLHRTLEFVGLVYMPQPVQPRDKREREPEQPRQYVLEVVTEPAGATVSVAGESFRAPGELILEPPEKALRVRISKRAFRTVWRRLEPEAFQAQDRVMRHRLKVQLRRPKEAAERAGKGEPAEKGEPTGKRDGRFTIWLEPVPSRPSPASSGDARGASGKTRPATKRAEPTAGSGGRPTIWLEPVPSRPAADKR